MEFKAEGQPRFVSIIISKQSKATVFLHQIANTSCISQNVPRRHAEPPANFKTNPKHETSKPFLLHLLLVFVIDTFYTPQHCLHCLQINSWQIFALQPFFIVLPDLQKPKRFPSELNNPTTSRGDGWIVHWHRPVAPQSCRLLPS